MYVRWKRRQLQRQVLALDAVLVCNVRVAGRPRQQLIGYLASIRVQDCTIPHRQQHFWRRVDHRLAGLGLDPITRQDVERRLAQMVPRPGQGPADSWRADQQSEVKAPASGAPAPAGRRRCLGGLYVRWKRRRLRRCADTALDAVLVRGVRVAGRPRQQLIGYLASIRVGYRTAPAHRAWFWTRIEARVAALRLDSETQRALEGQLVRVVPRPTPTELKDLEAQRAILRHLEAVPWTPRGVGSADAGLL